jgi:hypothetical protein
MNNGLSRCIPREILRQIFLHVPQSSWFNLLSVCIEWHKVGIRVFKLPFLEELLQRTQGIREQCDEGRDLQHLTLWHWADFDQPWRYHEWTILEPREDEFLLEAELFRYRVDPKTPPCCYQWTIYAVEDLDYSFLRKTNK